MTLRFNDFEIDPGRYELRRGGKAEPVEPLVFDLLLYLARNAGRVVTRDEVIGHVWQGRAISDATVAGAVKAARKALGDSGEDQSCIRTVRGRGFEFLAQVSHAAPPPAPPPAPAIEPRAPADARPVVAVLPFVNLATEDDTYFADGLTEDVIISLARFRDLLVIGAASVFRFRGPGFDLDEVRRRLGAGYFVQGSIRRSAGRVRISAQLTDAATGVQLWGDRYDRETGDLFELQDELTRTIAAALGLRIQDVALQRALTKTPAQMDAHDCLLRARRYTNLLDAEAHAESRELLERAVALNPFSADAHALLANVYLGEHRFGMNPRPDPIGRALHHAQTATRLDPQNAYARCWLAVVHFFRFENDRFAAEAERALALNPNDPETLADIGHYYAFMGQFDRGVSLARRAQRLNPLHPGWYWFTFARWHYDAGRYAEALSAVHRTGLPGFYWMPMLAAAAQGQLGCPAASASLAALRALLPSGSPLAELRKWNTAPHDLAHLMEGLRKAGLETA